MIDPGQRAPGSYRLHEIDDGGIARQDAEVDEVAYSAEAPDVHVAAGGRHFLAHDGEETGNVDGFALVGGVVVIGDGEEVETFSTRPGGEGLCGKRSIAVVRVRMQRARIPAGTRSDGLVRAGGQGGHHSHHGIGGRPHRDFDIDAFDDVGRLSVAAFLEHRVRAGWSVAASALWEGQRVSDVIDEDRPDYVPGAFVLTPRDFDYGVIVLQARVTRRW